MHLLLDFFLPLKVIVIKGSNVVLGAGFFYFLLVFLIDDFLMPFIELLSFFFLLDEFLFVLPLIVLESFNVGSAEVEWLVFGEEVHRYIIMKM